MEKHQKCGWNVGVLLGAQQRREGQEEALECQPQEWGVSRDVEKFDFNPGCWEKGQNLNVAVMTGWWTEGRTRERGGVLIRGWEGVALRGGRGMKRRRRVPRTRAPTPTPDPGGRKDLHSPRTAQAGLRAEGSDLIVWGSQGPDDAQNSQP